MATGPTPPALPHDWQPIAENGPTHCARCRRMRDEVPWPDGEPEPLCEDFPPCAACLGDVMDEMKCPDLKHLCVDCCGCHAE